MTYNMDTLFEGLLPKTVAATGPIPRVELALPYKLHQAELIDVILSDPSAMFHYVAAEMGVGKTVVGIGIIASVIAAGITPALLVVPPSLRTNWLREFKRFAPWLGVAVLKGTEVPEADVYIMGNSQLSSGYKPAKGVKVTDKKVYLSPLCKALYGKVQALIVDEAHFFKNKSNRTTAMGVFAASCEYVRIDMSGTPMPNGRHMELPGQIEILGTPAWNAIGGRGRFYDHFAPKIDDYARGNANGEELHELMSKAWFHRLLRADVPDMWMIPGVNDKVIYKAREGVAVECQGDAVRRYLDAEEDLFAFLRGEGRDTRGAERAEAIVQLTTMRRLLGLAKAPSVIEHVIEILEEEPGGVFVTAEHNEVMDILLAGLAKYKPMAVRGGMSDSKKQVGIDAFCSGQSRVLVGQTVAAGTGLTLHGDGRNYRVVIGQLPYTPAEFSQLEDRLYRIGQTHDVLSEVALGAIEGAWTIDERLWGQLEAKHFNASQTLDGKGEYLLATTEDIIDGLLDSYR